MALPPDRPAADALPAVAPGTVVLLVGPPAAGKSTFAARLVARGLVAARSVLSSDEVRAEVAGDEGDLRRDRGVFAAMRASLKALARAGETAVIDATNLTPGARAPWIRIARAAGRTVVAVRFDAPLAELTRRNELRIRRVPRGVLARLAREMARHGAAEQLRAEGCDEVVEADPG
jgi:predicted kinase